MACVELVGRLRQREDVNVGGETVVHGTTQPLGIGRAAQSQVRHLVQRVDAGIGPPRAMNAHVSPRNSGESLLQMILDRVSARLALPAGKGRSVVGDGEFQPIWHLLWRRLIDRFDPKSRALHSIEIALQNHLCRHLIDKTAGLPRLLARIAQGAVCCRSR